jgi:hypothetical protein
MMNWYFLQTDKTVWLGTSPKQEQNCFTAKQDGKRQGYMAKAK